MFNVTYSPSHRQAGAPMINIQSTGRTAPDLLKNVSAVLFGSNGNSYTVCKQSDYVCTYTHILYNIRTMVGQKN
jgi:hypothetical protein